VDPLGDNSGDGGHGRLLGHACSFSESDESILHCKMARHGLRPILVAFLDLG
jgi:hypothetical protein